MRGWMNPRMRWCINALMHVCKHKIDKLIHLSALGIESAKDSKYASSKLRGETVVRQNFKDAIILKPSIIYSVDDKFTTMLMGLLNIAPIFPLYYGGKTKFSRFQNISRFHLSFFLGVYHQGLTVHHGGAGTTCAALRAGVPTILTPISCDSASRITRSAAQTYSAHG